MTLSGQLSGVWGTLHRWKGRILFAFADQGLVSASNFLLTIVYAKWLPIDEFGRYVVVWTASLFIEAIQGALIVDPLPAIVSRFGRRNRQRIDIAAFWLVIAYGLAGSLVLAAAAAVLGKLSPNYAVPFLVLALVNPLQRLYLFFRRLCYIRDRQPVAAAAALAYCGGSLAGAGALIGLGQLSVGAALLVSGFGALAAVLTIGVTGVGQVAGSRARDVAWLASQIWKSGRWLAPAAVVAWLITWGIFPIVAAIGGAANAGILRALQNLLTPIVQFNSALNLAMLPRVADNFADHGDVYARKFTLRGTVTFTAIVSAYCAAVLAAAPAILPAIYRKPEITQAAFLLWPLSLAIIFEGARIASSMSLLAMRQTRIVLVARIVALVAFAGSGAVLVYFMNYVGILWANVLGTAVGTAIVIAAALKRGRARPPS